MKKQQLMDLFKNNSKRLEKEPLLGLCQALMQRIMECEPEVEYWQSSEGGYQLTFEWDKKAAGYRRISWYTTEDSDEVAVHINFVNWT